MSDTIVTLPDGSCRVPGKPGRHYPHVCEHCGQPFLAPKWKGLHRKYCCRRCTFIGTRIPLEERFWEKVNKNGSTPTHCPGIGNCWEWTGALSVGYGHFLDPRTKKVDSAHKIAYELIYQRGLIPEGMEILHACDNRKCVRDSHLSVGTRADNMADCRAKQRNMFGESHYHSQFTDKEVAEIRRRFLSGETVIEIALQLGKRRQTISSICFRKTWKHIH